jgi:hypothetical protein
LYQRIASRKLRGYQYSNRYGRELPHLKERYAMKIGFDRGLAEKMWTTTWKKGNTARTATAAAMNAIVPEDESTSQIK